ncbi:MAG: transglutaminase domain-containing protein [Planctomycetota bacterium]|nr:MAG: transglutaminase domain-containing protein [Planctomycetota bacterium]
MHRNAPVSVRLTILAGLVLSTLLVSTATAQSRRSRQQTPATPQTQPGQIPAAQAFDDLEPSPFIKRTKPKRWTLETMVFIGTTEWTDIVDGQAIPANDVWEFNAATLVFPVLSETASSILEVRGRGDEVVPAVSGKVEFDDRLMTEEVSIVKQGIGGGLLPAATWRAQWQVEPPARGAYAPREMELHVKTSIVSHEIEFDERNARAVEWPKGEWPPEAAATFQPQMLVDFDAQGRRYDMSKVVKLLQVWTNNKDPKSIKPVVLAKFLAGQVAEYVQPNGEGLAFDKSGMLEGFAPVGPVAAVLEAQGTEIDLPILLVAMYRAAGLPARLVIGYDEEGAGKSVYLKQSGGDGEIRVWVEFALYDEDNKTFGWVPVDVTALRSSSSKMPPNFLDRPVKFFGTHDELDRVAPIAFHFHPPTTVRSYGSPALWGWFVTPTPPGRADQRISFSMTSSPNGGRDQSRLPDDKR